MKNIFKYSLLAVLSVSVLVHAEVIIVDSAGDQPAVDATVSAVTAVGTITLRSAIERSNEVLGGNEIRFDILAGTAPIKINLGSQLNSILTPVFINGYSQPGADENDATDGSTNAVPGIELNGNGLELSVGLELLPGSDGSMIRGFVINEFKRAAITLSRSFDNVIAGNFIGTDASGTQVKRNQSGIEINFSSGNTIGGTQPRDKNLLAGSYNFFGLFAPVALFTVDQTIIEGNLIGLDKTGQQALGESTAGIFGSGSVGNRIRNNVISGNTNSLFAIFFTAASDGNMIQNNFIGTDITGTKALPNGRGIGIRTSSNNTIEDNLISGNELDGILIGISFDGPPSADNNVFNNKIGVDVTGSVVLPNGGSGIVVQLLAQNTEIEKNIISGNKKNGIFIGGEATGTKIKGNFIGTDIAGVLTISNEGNGIQLGRLRNSSSNTTIGGPTDAERNVISGNIGNGVAIEAESNSNEIRNNYIGTSFTGLELQRSDCQSYGNGENGVYILRSSNNLLEDNIITRNGKAGVAIESCTGEDAVDNAIVSNQIFNNCSLGIDFGRDGITPNDVQDPDLGPNRLQNFPVFTSVRRCGNATRVVGVLNSIPSTSFLLQFFSNDVNREGITEGKKLIGEMTLSTDGNGNAKFERAFPSNLTSGYFISATATRLEGDLRIETSEFNKGGLSKSCLTSCLINKVCKFKQDCVIDCN